MATSSDRVRRYADVQTAAEYGGMSERTVRRMIESRVLTAYRYGRRLLRVDLNELDDVLERDGRTVTF
jgi:excisionase family DNA binding protein